MRPATPQIERERERGSRRRPCHNMLITCSEAPPLSPAPAHWDARHVRVRSCLCGSEEKVEAVQDKQTATRNKARMLPHTHAHRTSRLPRETSLAAADPRPAYAKVVADRKALEAWKSKEEAQVWVLGGEGGTYLSQGGGARVCVCVGGYVFGRMGAWGVHGAHGHAHAGQCGAGQGT